MIANLPLLFANGNPTGLATATAAELERFISFMVACSWGRDTARDIRQPPWWPADVEFSHPFARPPVVPGDWESRLKSLVKRCYEFHKSAFLLVFSAQLARYPRRRLRYVDNCDRTTSLYYRPSGRLLVTFRNENMYYDRPKRLDTAEPQLKTDIYLCDNCDSHFDNVDILRAHERLCNNEEGPSSSSPTGRLPEFLSALKLKPQGEKQDSTTKNADCETKQRNARSAANIDRGPPYPFSSLAYLKNAKTNANRDLSYSRERVERYCCTSTPVNNKPSALKSKNQQFPIRYRRPIDYWQRKHIFPNQRHKDVLDLTGQLLLLKCRPISVPVERMSMDSMQSYIDNLRKEAESKKEKDIVFVDSECETAMDVEIRDPLKRVEECEVIDLCSDDESLNENCDPRAGVACVVRGGAVLRRTAATPLVLPAEPCGARKLPAVLLPAEPCGARQLPAVLHPHSSHPHPVILIAHTLNNIQTISID
ncbi:hypothetical protein MSG28_003057 [Choristoneura fumiferana]|uniref:Uncharacterized protein n=1 Tax=Choristoneura fumiferana TaxID=7141 RepID=A0ACC0JKE6_CHOFU|nr:hypothetical protein MSG28_003057 [Choristoneura fumiferana]